MTQLNIFSICIVLLILSRMTIEACSHVRVEMPTYDPMEKSKSIVGRTMELGPMFEWNVVVHPRGEKYNVLGTPASLCGDILNLTKFESEFGFVAIDTLKVTLEGMNEKGLTISPLIFESASYSRVTKEMKSAEATLCSGALSQYILGKYEKVEDLKKDLERNKISVFGPENPEEGSETSNVLTLLRHLARLHWAVDDAHGGHIVIEIVDGVVAVCVLTPRSHLTTLKTHTLSLSHRYMTTRSVS